MKYKATFSENLFDKDHTITAYGDANDLAMLNAAIQKQYYVSSCFFYDDKKSIDEKKEDNVPF